jgi:hypothetical protein
MLTDMCKLCNEYTIYRTVSFNKYVKLDTAMFIQSLSTHGGLYQIAGLRVTKRKQRFYDFNPIPNTNSNPINPNPTPNLFLNQS